MRDTDTALDRRNFLKTGAHAAAGVAISSAGAAQGARPTNNRIPLQGGIPEVEFGKTGHRLPILGHGGSAMVEQFIRPYGLELAPSEEYVNMVRLGYEKGIRYFDTARGYGLSEDRHQNRNGSRRIQFRAARWIKKPHSPLTDGYKHSCLRNCLVIIKFSRHFRVKI